MHGAFSIYLDLLRFLAALVVLVHHVAPITGDFQVFGRHGDDAVMVFFVLSGFVIAYISEREKTLPDYMASRLARLYSVAVPALLVTFVLDWIGMSIDPQAYDARYLLVRFLSALGFTSQLWGLDLVAGSNMPYWSISYEFWYYVAFAIFAFAKRRALWLAGWASFVGPPIVLLLPVWVLGVFAYRFKRPLRAPLAWGLFLLPLLYVPYCFLDLRIILTEATNSVITPVVGPYFLHKAQFFLHCYIIGLLVCGHFIGARQVLRDVEFGRLAQPIRVAAGYTFALYLLHFPLLKLMAELGITNAVALFAVTAAVVVIVGGPAERSKAPLKRRLLQLWEGRGGLPVLGAWLARIGP